MGGTIINCFCESISIMSQRSRAFVSHGRLVGRYLWKQVQWEMRRPLTTSLQMERTMSLPQSGLAVFGFVLLLYAIHSFWGRGRRRERGPYLTQPLCHPRVKPCCDFEVPKPIKESVDNTTQRGVYWIFTSFKAYISIWSTFLQLLLSGDVELNPGPYTYGINTEMMSLAPVKGVLPSDDMIGSDSGIGTHTNTAIKTAGELSCAQTVSKRIEIRLCGRRGLGKEHLVLDSLLHQMASEGDLEGVKSMIKDGKSPLDRMHGFTALDCAARNGHLHIVKYFVKELCTNPDIKGFKNCTPLHIAAYWGQVSIVQYLLDQGVEPLRHDDYNLTPLQYACRMGCIDVVKLLVRKMAEYVPLDEVFRGTEIYQHPLTLAIVGGDMATIEYLKARMTYNIAKINNSELLCAAIKTGKLDIVKFLITELHCDYTDEDEVGQSVLHHAVKQGCLDILKFFIDKLGCALSADEDGHNPIHIAAIEGRLDILKYLIDDKKHSPFCLDNLKNSPVLLAAANGHLTIVKYLSLDKGCDPANKNSTGSNMLHLAVFHGHIDVVKFVILNLKCSPDIVNGDGRSPIQIAAIRGHLNIMHYLIEEQGCNPCSLDKYEQTLLHLAAANRHIRVVIYLINRKLCDPMCKNINGSTPLHLAAEYGQMFIIPFLMSISHSIPVDKNGRNALHVAASKGHSNIVMYLIDEGGYSPYVLDKYEQTPLYLAAANGHLPVVDYLIRNKQCDPMKGNIDGSTPFHLAAQNGQLEVVQYFAMNFKSLCTILNKKGRDAIHAAAIKGHLNIIKYLVDERQCNPSSLDKYKQTPLLLAAANGHLSIVQYLTLDKNCDVLCKNISGSTPLHAAFLKGHIDVIKFLISKLRNAHEILDNDDRNALHIAAIHGLYDIVKYLLDEQKFSPHDVDKYEQTALHLAAGNGHLSIVKYLTLDKGCDPYHENIHGHTPLHLAAAFNNLDIIRFFIKDLNCPPDICGKNGQNLIHVAAMEGHLSIVQYLTLGKEGDINRVAAIKGDGMGLTPIHFAANGGHYDIVKFLVEDLHCDPYVRDAANATPLHLAAQNGDIKVIKYLTNAISDHDKKSLHDVLKCLPIHYAAYGGKLENIKFLIDEIVNDPCSRLRYDYTCLHCAAMMGHLEVVKYFIDEHSFDPSLGTSGQVTPLHLASLNGHLEVVSYLTLEKGCDPLCEDSHHKTPIFWATSEGQKEVVKFYVQELKCSPLPAGEFLEKYSIQEHELKECRSKSPGIVFHQKPIIQDVTPEGAIIEGMGIRLSIPDNSVEESLTLLIFPCLRGPFLLPEDYVSASPAYLIKCNRKVNFQKDIALRIHHYAYLESTSDCGEMVFLSASSTPEKRKDGPVYIFKEIEEPKGTFEPGDHVGEITLRHFCIVKLGRKRRRASHSPATKKPKENEVYYSARFYRFLSKAVFCVCLLQEVYTSHCDSVIMKRMEDCELSTFTAQLTADKVTISVTEGSAGWSVFFDKEPTIISNSDIHLPETLHKKVSKCPDYPPRLSITLCKVEDQGTQHSSNCIKFEVKGLDRECYFNIVIPVEVQVPPSSSGVSSMADTNSDSASSSSSTDTSQVQQGLDQALYKPPTMMDLLWCGEMNLAEEIGSNYFECGVFLLEDKNGARMRAIGKELNRNARDINYRIFEEWLSGSGKKPVTWGTLIAVLQKIQMTQLAETIAVIKKVSKS